MRYNPIENTLFKENRTRFTEKLKNKSIALFDSNDIMPTNADGEMSFIQNSDLYYLSGIDQEETKLAISKDENGEVSVFLFLRETSEEIAIWEGHKLTKEQATHFSGIENCYWLEEGKDILQDLIEKSDNIYINPNEHARATKLVETRNDRLNKWCRENFSKHNFLSSASILHDLRFVKSEKEIEQIIHAGKITGKAFKRILAFTKPSVYEYEIEAEMIHEFVRNGSRRHAFQPIVASGKDSCVLHYISNDKKCEDGAILLLDFGAEYANYNADITRCIPVNGIFSPRQKEVYNAVLRVKKGAEKLLVVGNTFPEYNKAVGKLMEKELIGLGLLDEEEVKNQDEKKPLYRKYFMHGTSHSLGLDVHDVDNRDLPFAENMIFTCEPGIYIPEEEIGVRLEDDILITEDGPINLTGHIPIEAEAIEELMKSR
ncbi:MAG: M24 family metallopeptidase [Cytophagales bacterium]|nr:M24 family metallopeptidase [Cytophagales bacterium]